MRFAISTAAFSAALLAAGDLSAQSVTGRLVDAESALPISNATISALDDGDSVLTGVLTDPNGRFTIVLAGSGQFRLRAERVGYRTSTTGPLGIGPDETLEVEFRLSTEAVVLEPITVTAEARPWWESQRRPEVWGLYERMDRFGHTGFGRFITPEDLERYRSAPAWAMLGAQIGFGIRVEMEERGTRRAVTMRGPLRVACSPVYFVDGLPFRAEEWVVHATIESLVSEDRVEGIEMFNPWYVPPEFASSLHRDEACVVAVWTREPGDPPIPPR